MADVGESRSSRDGQIVTFYSFKGGTGRTMALANVAWILAANGKRVLMADWDLESPGLHRFFQPFMDESASARPGIVDFVRTYEWAAVEAGLDPEALQAKSDESRKAAQGAVNTLVDEHIDQVEDYIIPLTWQFPDEGALHLLSPGKQGNSDYQMALLGLNWENFWND